VMVLHSGDRQVAFHFERVACREVVRMKVMYNKFGPDPEEPFVEIDRCREMFERLDVFKVPDMLAHKRVMVAGETEAALFLGPDCQEGSGPERQCDRERRITSRSPDRLRCFLD